jgi:2-polyprenyl-3-methyl-5-hydroxy-6-metoxy-1,4-benzoquinol methylase
VILKKPVKWFLRMLRENPQCADHASQIINGRTSPKGLHSAAQATPGYPMLDALLLCGFHLWRAREKGKRYEAIAISDGEGRYGRHHCVRTLAPWADWLSLRSHYDLSDEASRSAWEASPPRNADRVLCLVADRNRCLEVEQRCGATGAVLIAPDPPPVGTMDHDLLREVNHFHFELGAHNEWSGAPPQYSSPTLRHLSGVSCRMAYPAWAFEDLPRKSTPWKAIDIGCGPISLLRWGALSGDVEVTGIDPLLEMYALLKARHGYDRLPSIHCDHEIPEFAEDLRELVPDGEYDLIFTQNALDHTQIPEQVVAGFESKLTRQGRIAIAVATREGTRQKWDQFHKTDIDILDGTVVFRRQDTDWKPLFSSTSKLRLSKIHHHSPQWIQVVFDRP